MDDGIDEFGVNYLRLALEINKHVSGYIDAYNGPLGLKKEVDALPLREPELLLQDIDWLHENLPGNDPVRQQYVTALLRAMTCSVRLIQNEEIPYLEEVAHIYDIHPHRIPDSELEAVHSELDTLLPGNGRLADRIATYREHYNLPAKKALELLELARAETRLRTAALYDLPMNETVDIELVKDQPWSAYNWFKGNGRSLIEFNTDIPIPALGLISTFAHEGYPGHHTEAILKEREFLHEMGYWEMGVALLHSPAAVIAEGIATTAVEIIFPNGTQHAWNIEVLLPAAGIVPLQTAAEMRRLTEALIKLRYVSGNAAIRFHNGEFNRAQTIDYLCTLGLTTPERAAKSFGFMTHPLFRSYLFTYTQGYDLIAAASGGVDKRAIFDRCLTEQILPSQLAAETKS